MWSLPTAERPPIMMRNDVTALVLKMPSAGSETEGIGCVSGRVPKAVGVLTGSWTLAPGGMMAWMYGLEEDGKTLWTILVPI